MQPISDEFIVKQVRSGDSKAFVHLYERYKNTVYAYCLRLLQNEASAEDALQNTFMKAYQSISKLDDHSAFKYWLFTIARNEIHNLLRSVKKNGRVQQLNDNEEVWDEQTPLTIAVQTDTADIVQRLLGQLKSEYREVLVLREYERLSYVEIAALTGDTEASVRSRLYQAKKALAKKIRSRLL